MSLQRQGTSLPSDVSTTEISYLANVTSDIQAQLDAKLANTLTDGQIFVGNGSNVATGVAMSGNCTMLNTGAVTVVNVGGSPAANVGYTADVTSNIQAQFSARLPAIVTTSMALAGATVVSQPYADQAGANLAQVSNVQVTVVATANEKVRVEYTGALGGATGSETVLGYQVDSATPVPVKYWNTSVVTQYDAGFSVPSVALTAGSRVIKLMACRTNANVTLTGPANYTVPTFTVTQYR